MNLNMIFLLDDGNKLVIETNVTNGQIHYWKKDMTE